MVSLLPVSRGSTRLEREHVLDRAVRRRASTRARTRRRRPAPPRRETLDGGPSARMRPASSTSNRSQCRAASVRSWRTTSAAPPRSTNPRSMRIAVSWWSGSRFAVGSSRSTMGACWAKARARCTRCSSPEESVPSVRSASDMVSVAASARSTARDVRRGSPRRRAPREGCARAPRCRARAGRSRGDPRCATIVRARARVPSSTARRAVAPSSRTLPALAALRTERARAGACSCRCRWAPRRATSSPVAEARDSRRRARVRGP